MTIDIDHWSNKSILFLKIDYRISLNSEIQIQIDEFGTTTMNNPFM